MTSRADAEASADRSKQGRFDPARFSRPNPADQEPRPEVTPEDVAATRAELDELKRRTRRRGA
jgi:hypothetical protein